MKKILVASFLAATTSLSACSSIVSKSTYPVIIKSIPSEAAFTIRDINGNDVEAGTTPETVTLKASSGFFKKQQYTVEFKKEGFPPQTLELTATLDGWYWGNLIFGGLIGMLIVDPATGSMYNLPADIEANLTGEPIKKAEEKENMADDISAGINRRSLTLRSIDSLTAEQIAQLELIR